MESERDKMAQFMVQLESIYGNSMLTCRVCGRVRALAENLPEMPERWECVPQTSEELLKHALFECTTGT